MIGRLDGVFQTVLQQLICCRVERIGKPDKGFQTQALLPAFHVADVRGIHVDQVAQS